MRLEIDAGEVVAEERIPLGARIRDVKVGPDANVYVLTDPKDDQGMLMRLRPAG